MPKVSAEHLANRRRQILDAAAKCFADNGFHRTSMQDIVKGSGLSAGLIYRYFTGKDDMIAAIVEEWQTRRTATLGAADLDTGFLDLLRTIAGEESAQERNLSMQAWAETVREPRIRALARQGVDDTVRAFGDTVPESVVRVGIAIYQGLLLQASWDDTLDVEAFVESVRGLMER
ncbi:TetR/AcrR family transcriptional regulator [Actinophytocola oryzae]|uniref:TetR family transcriptional regulator n=1 Tax=Actinophytocola oryzae TaxID=502181 RepID=A0A4R7UWN5_9PSEU|nr:TetR/AcrR family transcriptional regulator [Actinophytocola oryzae]TDV40392.1 TetR family transcriptional regulator [Actinophytocola oryzae]